MTVPAVSWLPALKTSVPVPWLLPPWTPSWMDEQTAVLTSTVSVAPFFTMTLSMLVGAGEIALQSLFAMIVIVASLKDVSASEWIPTAVA